MNMGGSSSRPSRHSSLAQSVTTKFTFGPFLTNIFNMIYSFFTILSILWLVYFMISALAIVWLSKRDGFGVSLRPSAIIAAIVSIAWLINTHIH